MAAVLALATALVLGAAAGYGGRALDGVIMWTPAGLTMMAKLE